MLQGQENTSPTLNNDQQTASGSAPPGQITTGSSTFRDDRGWNLQHVQRIAMNEDVSVSISGRGWIVGTALAICRFMGRSTGNAVVITYLGSEDRAESAVH